MIIYLDQNILGHLRDKTFSLPQISDVQWAYSNEHFNEIARGGDTAFLDVLGDLRARQLEVLLDDQFKITEQGRLHEYSCPRDRYERHRDTVEKSPGDDSLFVDLLARLCGADNFDAIRNVTERTKHELEAMAAQLGEAGIELRRKGSRVANELGQFIEAELRVARPLESLRKPLGTSRGRAGDLGAVENPIPEIWKLIEPHCSGATIDEFFGFDPRDKQGYEKWPTYLGIVGCCFMLNFVGFRTDRGITKPETLRNVISDGAHIAHAAYCDAVISADRRLCAKAKAIYKYRNISTHVLRLELTLAK